MGIPTRTPDHTKTLVSVVPSCDLPHDEPVLAYADARMVRYAGRWTGSWANVCRDHFDQFGCELGLGKGQRFVGWRKGDTPSESNDYACQVCGQRWGH